jgi:hypothetical protein
MRSPEALERAARIELAMSVWKTDALPLGEARLIYASTVGTLSMAVGADHLALGDLFQHLAARVSQPHPGDVQHLDRVREMIEVHDVRRVPNPAVDTRATLEAVNLRLHGLRVDLIPGHVGRLVGFIVPLLHHGLTFSAVAMANAILLTLPSERALVQIPLTDRTSLHTSNYSTAWKAATLPVELHQHGPYPRTRTWNILVNSQAHLPIVLGKGGDDQRSRTALPWVAARYLTARPGRHGRPRENRTLVTRVRIWRIHHYPSGRWSRRAVPTRLLLFEGQRS